MVSSSVSSIKLTFLVRLLAVVSKATETSVDIFVSPSKILCGQDVPRTLEFIRTLGQAILMTEAVMDQAVNYVLEAGDNNLYKRGVRTRRGFVTFQAAYRGWLVRRKHHFEMIENGAFARCEVAESIQQSKPIDEDSISSLGNSVAGDECDEADESPLSPTEQTQQLFQPRGPVVKPDDATLLESYNTLVARKAAVEDEIKLAEEKLKTETERLKRILNIRAAHKKSTITTSAKTLTHITRPLSSPQIGTSTPAKTFGFSYIPIDGSFSDKITNFSTIQLNLKKKERRLNERELSVKQKLASSKQREESLKLQEERVTDLAGKIRKQQINLKEQKLKFDRIKAIKPPSPPNTSSRPCSFCNEKEIRLRKLRGKMRERMGVLSQREAYVIEKANELRRREIQLAERERAMANATDDIKESQHSTSRSHCYKLTHGTNFDGTADKNHENGMDGQRSPQIDRQNENSKRKTTRRRSGRNPDCGGSSEDQIESVSIRESFSEKVPTIMEETQSSCEDESDDCEEVSSCRNEELSITGSTSAGSTDRKCDKIFKQTTINRSTSNTPQSSRWISKPSSVPKSKKMQGEKSGEPIPPSQSPVATLSKVSLKVKTPKKKHVYTFEKRDQKEKNASAESDSFMQHMSKGSDYCYLSTPDKPKKDTKTRATKDKTDDWISNFDMQMKSAMNKLRDLS